MSEGDAPSNLEHTIDISEVDVLFFNDPIPTHLTRMLIMFENPVLLKDHDYICTDCIGDKYLPAFEYLPDQSEESITCRRCSGTGRIERPGA